MAELHEEIAQEVAGRQAEITSALRALEGLDEEDPQYVAAFARLVQAGTALLEYEAEVPAKLEQPQLQVSTKSFTVALWAHAACAVLLGVASSLEWIGGWWTLFAIVQLIGTSALWVAGQNPRPGKHRQLRHAASVLGVVIVMVPLLAFGLLPGWVWLLPLLGWASSYGLASVAGEGGAEKVKA
ncbi:hypothetical protein ACFV9E_30575 [Streptomyces sp. NPDC059835]|uniref:hypothetical protein n=1 Tax=Streptomyces sp. NPDC059835 TaxID=3346967 RepID=UPI00364D8948